jgi:hypothetical protein
MKVKKYVKIYHEVIASLKNVDSSPFYWKIIFRKLIMETDFVFTSGPQTSERMICVLNSLKVTLMK